METDDGALFDSGQDWSVDGISNRAGRPSAETAAILKQTHTGGQKPNRIKRYRAAEL